MGRYGIAIFLATAVVVAGTETMPPPGWQVNAVAFDRSLEAISDESLIDRLTEETDSPWNREPGEQGRRIPAARFCRLNRMRRPLICLAPRP